MIRLQSVTQHYSVRPVLQEIDLTIHSGELVGILGPNGMGKSTLLQVMAGILTPQVGQVLIDGNLRRGSVESELAARQCVAFVPDHPWLPKLKTGREVALGIGRLYGVDELHLMRHADRLMEIFDLAEKQDAPIESYSNGQRHKIAIIAALLTEAPVLLLDEPFSGGLDPAGILALKQILRHLVEKENATIVISTPVPEVVENLADRFAILENGKLIAIAALPEMFRRYPDTHCLSEVLQSAIHPETGERVESYLAAR